MNLKHFKTTGKNQEGATLFISLILLFVITLVCIIAMRTSLLELVMANNTQQSNNSFQAAESVLENSIINMSVTIDGTDVKYITEVDGSLKPINPADLFLSDIDEIQYKGSGNNLQAKASGNVFLSSITPANGWQLDLDAQAVHFRIETNAQSASGKAVSNNSAGVYIIAPSSDGSN